MILGSAQGAVDSLLGRLTSVLVDEAQLLGGVRSDVQFIKDEMEHVAEADEEDHQVGAWMKQVAEVAYASQNSVDRYIQSIGAGRREPGLLGYLRRLPKLVWTLPTRHRIANQIRELKIRSCEVGERRMRYDVKVPEPIRDRAKVMKKAGWQAAVNDDTKEEEDAQRRALADALFPETFYKDTLIKLLTNVGEEHGGGEQHNLKVLAVVGVPGIGKSYTAKSAYQDPFAVSSFDCKAWISVWNSIPAVQFFRQILEQLASPADQFDLDGKDEEELMAQLQLHLTGKRFLVVIDDVNDRSISNRIKSAFPHENCCPGSAIVITTRSIDMAQSFSPNEYLDTGGSNFYLCNAMALLNRDNQSIDLQPVIREIDSKPLSIRLFLPALYVNPNRTKADLQSLCDNLDDFTTPSSNNARQVLKFGNLTSNCKNCLLYMSIFPENTIFKRTRLVRRWAVEGMTAKRGRLSALDEADHCFDVLIAHGFLTTRDMSVAGKVKSCTMSAFKFEIVTQIAIEDDFVKNNHQPDLAHRLSVCYEGQPHQAGIHCSIARCFMHDRLMYIWTKLRRKYIGHFNPCYQTTVEQSNDRLEEQSNATEEFLESLPSWTHLGILEVLDLEDCSALKDHHLKNICSHVFHLKYLSLRKTGITQLPKQLGKLQSLETLDIRETKVKAFAKNSVFLPKLKHLLAGHWTDEELVVNRNVQSKETFFTVAMPKYIGGMTEL